jgi:hypothetical protein
VLASGEAWRDARDAEVIRLRKELEGAEAQLNEARRCNVQLKDKYDRLRHATSDPNYILVGGSQHAPAVVGLLKSRPHAVVQVGPIVGPVGKDGETRLPPPALPHPFSPPRLAGPSTSPTALPMGDQDAPSVDDHVASHHPTLRQGGGPHEAEGNGGGGAGGPGVPHHTLPTASSSAAARGNEQLRGGDLLSTFTALPEAMQQRIDEALSHARASRGGCGSSRTPSGTPSGAPSGTPSGTPRSDAPLHSEYGLVSRGPPPRTPSSATSRPARALSSSKSAGELSQAGCHSASSNTFEALAAGATVTSRLRQIEALERVAGVISGLRMSREAWK